MRFFLLFTLLLCLLGAIGCGKGIPYSKGANSTEPSPSRAATVEDPYKAVKAATDELTRLPSSVRLDPKGYIKGQAVQFDQTIDYEDKEKKEKPRWTIDQLVRLHDMAPPKRLEDITTVVLRKCEEYVARSYGLIAGHETVATDVKGLGWKCEITVVDKTIPAVIARKKFEAMPSEYASVKPNEKTVTVNLPLIEMRDYLKSLERK